MNTRGIELVNVAPYLKDKGALSELAKRAKVAPKGAENLVRQMVINKDEHKRQPLPPIPEGGISLSEASRKYNVIQSTLSRWASKGYIPILLRTNRELYIEELAVVELVNSYKQNPGRGKKTIKQSIKTA